MTTLPNVILSTVILFGLVSLAAWLKHIGAIKKEHGALFAGLVTRVTLPALIFATLLKSNILWSEASLAGVTFAAECVCLCLAFGAARLLALDRPRAGAFILASSFGSSTMLGYVLVAQLFPGDAGAMTEAVIVSELGVGPALFTLGVMIAAHFGSTGKKVNLLQEASAYFRSPIFLAVVLGFACNLAGLGHEVRAVRVLDRFLEIPAAANAWLVLLTVGVSLERRGTASAPTILAACLILLAVQPFLATLLSEPLRLPHEERVVLILQSCMPSALLSVPLSVRYGLDASLAARLVLATTAVSVVSVPVLMRFL